MIIHSYSNPEFLQTKYDDCDFLGLNEVIMKMYIKRLYCEKISCGIFDLEVENIETLDVHTFTCERFKYNWCKKIFNMRSTLSQYNCMRNNEEF